MHWRQRGRRRHPSGRARWLNRGRDRARGRHRWWRDRARAHRWRCDRSRRRRWCRGTRCRRWCSGTRCARRCAEQRTRCTTRRRQIDLGGATVTGQRQIELTERVAEIAELEPTRSEPVGGVVGQHAEQRRARRAATRRAVAGKRWRRAHADIVEVERRCARTRTRSRRRATARAPRGRGPNCIDHEITLRAGRHSLGGSIPRPTKSPGRRDPPSRVDLVRHIAASAQASHSPSCARSTTVGFGPLPTGISSLVASGPEAAFQST